MQTEEKENSGRSLNQTVRYKVMCKAKLMKSL